MDAISYTAARSNLAKTMEQVCEDHSPVIITRSKARSVVMMSLEDYEALQETAYLLRGPKKCPSTAGIRCRAGGRRRPGTETA